MVVIALYLHYDIGLLGSSICIMAIGQNVNHSGSNYFIGYVNNLSTGIELLSKILVMGTFATLDRRHVPGYDLDLGSSVLEGRAHKVERTSGTAPGAWR